MLCLAPQLVSFVGKLLYDGVSRSVGHLYLKYGGNVVVVIKLAPSLSMSVVPYSLLNKLIKQVESVLE